MTAAHGFSTASSGHRPGHHQLDRLRLRWHPGDLVRNAQGTSLTPSVVRFDAKGVVTVGAKARRLFESDPQNTRGEFKRLMGTAQRLAFPASKKQLLPQELSAEVLKSLRADVQEQFGFAPLRAVISVPALFELPQSAATSEAAQLAGFEQVELISLGGLEERRLAHSAIGELVNFGVWLFNVREQKPLANAIFVFMWNEALALGDEDSAKLNEKNARCAI